MLQQQQTHAKLLQEFSSLQARLEACGLLVGPPSSSAGAPGPGGPTGGLPGSEKGAPVLQQELLRAAEALDAFAAKLLLFCCDSSRTWQLAQALHAAVAKQRGAAQLLLQAQQGSWSAAAAAAAGPALAAMDRARAALAAAAAAPQLARQIASSLSPFAFFSLSVKRQLQPADLLQFEGWAFGFSDPLAPLQQLQRLQQLLQPLFGSSSRALLPTDLRGVAEARAAGGLRLKGLLGKQQQQLRGPELRCCGQPLWASLLLPFAQQQQNFGAPGGPLLLPPTQELLLQPAETAAAAARRLLLKQQQDRGQAQQQQQQQQLLDLAKPDMRDKPAPLAAAEKPGESQRPLGPGQEGPWRGPWGPEAPPKVGGPPMGSTKGTATLGAVS
ncbi:hypothetical protein ETH_00034090 [Eimeria tenella]|uniref:Uncharacterized protein n=1 Tax=Eimeria tenella TaxID=5802 RepID=U6KVE3_EIMTE|nr:hypothetical protein ETH_00034090 [Eimeria tenella]CDJ40339.1 hypothetical protein ETH_00034090 [Eimeria tenella]|eukprot:XP_013231089.1 hypothetical protein ETH_00034090 [Eimeria tenella]